MAYDFDKIADKYDRLNHLMTFGLDRRWRKRAISGLKGNVLDVACGTGDMVMELQKRRCTVTGMDLSEGMVAVAKQKTNQATFVIADAEKMPFVDRTFDSVTCAFGVRNFVHLEQGLSEMLRVLKPGGRMVILELATPDNPLIRPFYNFYTRRIIPRMGKCIAGNREAYTYLPASVERFPKGNDFLRKIQNSGFRIQDSCEHKLFFGVCRLYVATK